MGRSAPFNQIGVMLRRSLVLSGCLAAALFGAVAAQPLGYAGSSDQEIVRDQVQSGAILPLGEVLPGVKASVPGKLLDAQLEGATYQIKLLQDNGQVRIVSVDARSGAIIGVQ